MGHGQASGLKTGSPSAATADLGTDRREARILVACARTRIASEQAASLRALLDEQVDWTYLVQAALAHRVTPLVCRTLARVCADDIPDEILAALRVHFEDNRQRNLQLVGELRAILAALDTRGIPAIPFKGPVLAAFAYGDVALRPAGDLDILVGEADVTGFCELLVERGYRPDDDGHRWTPAQDAAYRRYNSQYLFVRESDNVMVEPHWAISPRTLAIPLDHDGLWQRAGYVRLAGERVPCFGLEDLLLVLCLHGTKHQWVELRWICDIAELVARHAEIDWGLVMERARGQGCARIFLLSMALARLVLGVALPPPVQRGLDADPTAAALARRAGRRLFREGNVTTSPFKVDLFRLRSRERLRDKLAYVFRSMTTPRFEHYGLVPLPSRLFFLNYPIKIVHDYALLPLWLAGKRAFAGGTARETTAAALRSAVRERWSERSSDWLRWADERGDWAARLNAPLLDAADIAPGQRVLDLASGVGEPALGIARRLGGDGLIVASDLVGDMVAGTRLRATAAGYANLYGCVADMEALPFEDASFDRAVCRFGIMFCPRVDVALAEILRVLRPGSRAAFLVWGPREDNTMFDVLYDVIQPLSRDVRGDDPLGPFRFGLPGSLSAAMRSAGFDRVEEREMRFVTNAPEGSRFWRANLEMLCGSWIAKLPSDAREALDRSIEAAFAPYRGASIYSLDNHVRIAVGARS